MIQPGKQLFRKVASRKWSVFPKAVQSKELQQTAIKPYREEAAAKTAAYVIGTG